MFRVPTFDELQKETSYIRLELTGQLHNPCLGTQRICIVKRNQLRGLTKHSRTTLGAQLQKMRFEDKRVTHCRREEELTSNLLFFSPKGEKVSSELLLVPKV